MNNWAKELNRQFSKRKVQMANKCFNVLNIFSYPGKTRAAPRLGISPGSLAAIKKDKSKRCWGCGERRMSPCLLAA